MVRWYRQKKGVTSVLTVRGDGESQPRQRRVPLPCSPTLGPSPGFGQNPYGW